MSRIERHKRLLERRSGVAGTSSSDFFHLVFLLYRHSEEEAKRHDGNCSCYVWAAIPMLQSGLCALLVEANVMLSPKRDEERIKDLDRKALHDLFKQWYAIPDELYDDLKLLGELRNELIHPAHTSTGTADNWPEYLKRIKEKGLLQSTGDPAGDYIMLSQIASHRLLVWAIDLTEQLWQIVFRAHPEKYLDWALPLARIIPRGPLKEQA